MVTFECMAMLCEVLIWRVTEYAYVAPSPPASRAIVRIVMKASLDASYSRSLDGLLGNFTVVVVLMTNGQGGNIYNTILFLMMTLSARMR